MALMMIMMGAIAGLAFGAAAWALGSVGFLGAIAIYMTGSLLGGLIGICLSLARSNAGEARATDMATAS